MFTEPKTIVNKRSVFCYLNNVLKMLMEICLDLTEFKKKQMERLAQNNRTQS